MNALLVLALQRLDATSTCEEETALMDSGDSVCCNGSTKSCRDCCNTWVE